MLEPVSGAVLHESCVTDNDAPTFDADWQRHAFGLAVALSEFGHYPWDAFQRQLIAAIADWEATSGDAREDWAYYEHWLAALERVVVESGLLTSDDVRLLASAPA